MEPVEARSYSLRDYSRILRRRKWYIIVPVLLAVGAGLGLSARQKAVYESSAQLVISTRNSDSVFATNTQVVSNPDRLIATEIRILESPSVAAQVRTDLKLDATAPLAGVSGSSVSATDVVLVTVRSGDPNTAATLANAYAKAYIEVKLSESIETLKSTAGALQSKVDDLQKQIDAIDKQVLDAPTSEQSTLQAQLAPQRSTLVSQQSVFQSRIDQSQVDQSVSSGGATLVDTAVPNATPVEPKPIRTTALAFIVGLLVGLGIALLVDYLDDSIRLAEDVDRATGGTPSLGRVPYYKHPDERAIAISRPADLAVESYRSVRTSLLFASLDRPMRTIQFSSSISSDGKTSTAANMAIVLAQAGHSVLIVDADLRKPRLHEMFATTGTVGLTNVLLGESLNDSIQLEVAPGLDLLPAGSVPANPSEMLGGRRMRELLDQLTALYDYVILDSAPLLPVTDSLVLSGLVDALVLVVRSGRDTTKQLTAAVSSLKMAGAPVVGTIFNGAGADNSYGYKGYGQRGYGQASYVTSVVPKPAPSAPAPQAGVDQDSGATFVD
ncbi:MAG: chromosome partitioning protein [Ilumatobacteraceae bacterium]|nr:chromosome partitioning protein [Ilumatobacteraceae bacterium]